MFILVLGAFLGDIACEMVILSINLGLRMSHREKRSCCCCIVLVVAVVVVFVVLVGCCCLSSCF